MTSRLPKCALVLFVLACAHGALAQVTLTQGTNFAVDVAPDGRLAIDLLNRIWLIPAGGGAARALSDGSLPARKPRWSPDGQAIVYELRDHDQEQVWIYRVSGGSHERLSTGQFYDTAPAWHPDGDRIVYSSHRRDTGFDLWELDIATRLTWRITSLPGDESEPAWSADGQDLAYIHRQDGQWSLMLRRRGLPDEVLETSDTRLSSPAWRPDGSLITVMRHAPEGLSVEMVILSQPVLVRPLLSDEDFFVAPVAWLDRHQLVYTANGHIRTRLFNSWSSSDIPFRATVRLPDAAGGVAPGKRTLPQINAPGGRLVIRTARLFDGVGSDYRENLDIVIDGARITAVEPRAEWPGAIVVDLGNLTALPGFIDGHAALPARVDASLGPVLLSFGLTTVVTDNDRAVAMNERWSGKEMPGPLVLGSDWKLDLVTASALAPGAASAAVSPRGIRYEDARVGGGTEATTMLSGLADSRTRGLPDLLRSRQARLLRPYPTALRRYVETPRLAPGSSDIVMGSVANGLPPGIALHAEFLALAQAGLDPEHVLKSAGVNAAAALGLGLQAGRIATGASADLVIVDGDPLADVSATVKVVGVVRNGRFFSTIGLLDRVGPALDVE